MGGKIKQRTKNNVRPSSSGRSAELLNNATKLESPFSQTPGAKIPALFPTLAVAALDQNIAPEYALCLKKLNKKDPITKTKALQELYELVSNSNGDDMVPALSNWAHLYKMLSIDPDHKVREATQTCHGAIVRACGRRTARVLRTLLGAWLAAANDGHAPAANAASNALHSTFPPNKFPEVLSYCKVEVMAYLTDCILGNQDTLALHKVPEPTERECVVSRAARGGLAGLAAALAAAPDAEKDWFRERLDALLAANAFWKLANNGDLQIRASWLTLMSRITELYSDGVWSEYGPQISRAILSNKAPHAHVWACLLTTMHHVKDWHKWFDKKEVFSKKLFDLLQEGGWGDAKELSNMLLPVLAHFPSDLLTKEFYETFFKSILVGLEKKAVINSKTERQCWVTGLAECLRYLSIQPNDFALEVTTSVHRLWLERILTKTYDGQTRTNLIKHSATNMASLVKYWLKQTNDTSQKYDHLVRNFWQNIGATIVNQVDHLSMDREEISLVIEGHILLLQTLKTSFLQEPKKQLSIKFDDEIKQENVDTQTNTQAYDANVSQAYTHNLNNSVEKICSHYFEFANKSQLSSCVISPLLTLLKEFDSKSLFLAIASQFGCNSVFAWYDQVLKRWLSGDAMRCKEVLDVIYIIRTHVNEEEQKALFESFKQFPPYVVEWCILKSLSHPHCSDAVVRWWLSSELVTSTVVSAVSRAASREPGARNLVLMCLSQDDDGATLVSANTVCALATALGAALKMARDKHNEPNEPSDPCIDTCAELCAELCSALSHVLLPAQLKDLVDEMLLYLLDSERGEAWCDVRGALQDARAAAAGAYTLIHKALADISNGELDIEKVERIVSLCPYLLKDFGEGQVPDDCQEAVQYTKKLFDFQPDGHVPITAHALKIDCIRHNLNCPIQDTEIMKSLVLDSNEKSKNDLTKEDLKDYAIKYIFRAMYLKTIFVHKSDDDDTSENEPWCNRLLNETYFVYEFSKLLHDYGLLRSVHEGYAFCQLYKITEPTISRLDLLLNDIISEINDEHRVVISNGVSNMAATNGYYWSDAMALFHNKTAKPHSKKEECIDFSNLDQMLTGSGFFHSLQADIDPSNLENIYRTNYILSLRSLYSAHALEPSVLDSTLAEDCARNAPMYALDVLVNVYYRHNQVMLFEKDISPASWSSVVYNSYVARTLSTAVQLEGWELPSHVWDYTTITLCSMLTSIDKSKQNWGSTKVSMLAQSVFELYRTVHSFIKNVPAECERRAPSEHVANLPTEWKDIFAPDINSNMERIYMHVLQSSAATITSNEAWFISALVECASLFECNASGITRALRLCCDVVGGEIQLVYKLAAIRLLNAQAKPIVLADAEKLSQLSGEESSQPALALHVLHEPLQAMQAQAELAVNQLRSGDEPCILAPYSDEYASTCAYLQLAQCAYALCALARGDLLHHCLQIIREQQYVSALVPLCLRLLPAAVLKPRAAPAANVALPHAAHFTTDHVLQPTAALKTDHISTLACRVLLCALRGGGAGGGGGAAAGGAGAERALDMVVRTYVAPALVREQFLLVQKYKDTLEDIEITIHWSSNELVSVFTVEDHPVELTVGLPPTYPLAPPTLSCKPHDTNTNWLVLYLGYQCGSVLNAIRMWRRGVSSRVARAPQCYICYCRLEPRTGALPQAACRQCKNKFHTSCVRKWFSTSNKSYCPLCRGVF